VGERAAIASRSEKQKGERGNVSNSYNIDNWWMGGFVHTYISLRALAKPDRTNQK
jgi:hypothetical protein